MWYLICEYFNFFFIYYGRGLLDIDTLLHAVLTWEFQSFVFLLCSVIYDNTRVIRRFDLSFYSQVILTSRWQQKVVLGLTSVLKNLFQCIMIKLMINRVS